MGWIRIIRGLARVLAFALTLGNLPAQAETPPNILVIAARLDGITTLDPQEAIGAASADLLNNIYGGLVAFDPADSSKGAVPDIAESWDVSDDGRVFTFKIRPGLSFASGNPVTAEDVAFSLRRAVAMNRAGAPILTQFGLTADNMEETLVAGDDMTFRLTTDQPYAESLVLNSLTATVARIIDRALVKPRAQGSDWGSGLLRKRASGSGPYRLVTWTKGQSYTLDANPGYWRGTPAMARVIVRHSVKSESQRLLLERGDVDIARNLAPEDLNAVASDPALAIDSGPRGRILYLALNQKHPVLSDPKVREALKYLVDYRGLAETALAQRFRVHQSFIPTGQLGALDQAPYALDVAKAKTLLAEAGYGDGFAVELILRDAGEVTAIAESLQKTFAEAGIILVANIGDAAEVLARYRGREFDIYFGAWDTGLPDPDGNARAFAHNPDNSDEANLTAKLAWRVGWDIPEMTQLTDMAAAERDPAKRAQLYLDLQRAWQLDAPFVPMFQSIARTARRANVSGFRTAGSVSAAAYWAVAKE